MLLIYIYVALASYNTQSLTLPLTSVENVVDEAANVAAVSFVDLSPADAASVSSRSSGTSSRARRGRGGGSGVTSPPLARSASYPSPFPLSSAYPPPSVSPSQTPTQTPSQTPSRTRSTTAQRNVKDGTLGKDRRRSKADRNHNHNHSHNDDDDRTPPWRPPSISPSVVDVDWRTLWNEGTDAVLDVPIGGVCEILYGCGRGMDF